jgi:predicted naringenin-chalcone synthase
VPRVHVGDTGCAAAMVALQQAWNHLQAFPAHRALSIAVELCSTAYFVDDRLESAVAHAIFADGAGALALAREGAGPTIIGHRTLFNAEHLPAMGFEYPEAARDAPRTCGSRRPCCGSTATSGA